MRPLFTVIPCSEYGCHSVKVVVPNFKVLLMWYTLNWPSGSYFNAKFII